MIIYYLAPYTRLFALWKKVIDISNEALVMRDNHLNFEPNEGSVMCDIQFEWNATVYIFYKIF